MRSVAVLVAAAALLAGCGGDDEEANEYREESIDAFVAECRKQPAATLEGCRCVIGRLQETMPYDEFAAADEALTERREPEPAALAKLEAAVRQCGSDS